MSPPTVVVDTGPVVALLDASEAHHEWAQNQFDALSPPSLTYCRAFGSIVLRQRIGEIRSLRLRLVELGVLCDVRLLDSGDDTLAMARPMHRYRQFPICSAAAGLVWLVERTVHGSFMTLNLDFQLYRQTRRRVIPLLTPA